MVPVLMQTPPTTSRRSITATRFPILRSLNRGALPGRTGSDHDQIIILHCDQSNASGASDVLQFENGGLAHAEFNSSVVCTNSPIGVLVLHRWVMTFRVET